MKMKTLLLTVLVGWIAAASAWADLEPADINGSDPPGEILPGAPGDYTITGGGQDIWGTSDQFFFAHLPDLAVGDFTAIVGVQGFGAPHEWAKTGIMARANLSPGSVQTMVIRSYGRGVETQWRDFQDQYSGNAPMWTPWTPDYGPGDTVWLRLDRQGNTFTGSYAVGGVSAPTAWKAYAVHYSPEMTPDVYLGLATTSHLQGEPIVVEYIDFTVGPYEGPPIYVMPDLPEDLPSYNEGYIGVREVINNGAISNQSVCLASLASHGGEIYDYQAQKIKMWDSGLQGHFTNDDPFGVVTGGMVGEGDVDNIAMMAHGAIHIPPGQGGDWTFGVNSDDGFTLMFPGKHFSSAAGGELVHFTNGTAITFWDNRPAADTLGVINLPAGDHSFWLTYHEWGGGAAVEFFAARGAHAGWNPDDFRLVGHQSTGAYAIPGLVEDCLITSTIPGTWDEQITNLDIGLAALANGDNLGSNSAATYPLVNIGDPDDGGGFNHGAFPGDFMFPGNQPDTDDDDYAVRVTGILAIPMSGLYHIGFNSDDGASLQIFGRTWLNILFDATGNGIIAGDQLINDSLTASTFTVGEIYLEEGTYDFEALMFERNGGSYFEIFGRASVDPSWHLLETGQAQVVQDLDGVQFSDPPQQTAQRQNINLTPIGGGASTCGPDESKDISSKTDTAGNTVRLRCEGAFLLQYVPQGQNGCVVGQCIYTWGENVGWVEYNPAGEFVRTVWKNYEGHVNHNPAGMVYDKNGNGGEDRDTYIYDVTTKTITIVEEVRMLNNGRSDPGQPWIEESTYVKNDYCLASPPPVPGLDPFNITPSEDIISNAPRSTSVQFVGQIIGGGQVVIVINGVEIIVPTDDSQTPSQLAAQVVQQFNQAWQEGPAQQQQQGKSASQDPIYGQIVRLHNVDEEEVQIEIANEPALGQNFYPYPVQGVQGTQGVQGLQANVDIGGAGSTCGPDEFKTISSKSDPAGNVVQLKCEKAYGLYYIPAQGVPCIVGACRYKWGENVGQVRYNPDGTFAKTIWKNYEGHVGHDPAGKVADQPAGYMGHGYENREIYTYDVQSRTWTIQHQQRVLTPDGRSNWGAPWLPWGYFPTETISNYCGPAPAPPSGDGQSAYNAHLPPPPEEFISNAPRLTPLQFTGDVHGGGRVVININDYRVIVHTDQSMTPEQLAGQVVQQFNQRWQQGQQQDQGKSATQDGQTVYIRNADEDEINVMIVAEPDLRFIFSPPGGSCVFGLLGDFNNDCTVNLVDLARFAKNWLVDCTLTPADPRCTPPITGHGYYATPISIPNTR